MICKSPDNMRYLFRLSHIVRNQSFIERMLIVAKVDYFRCVFIDTVIHMFRMPKLDEMVRYF